MMRGKLRAHALPFLGALGSDLTRAGMPRVFLKVGFAVHEFFNAAVGMVCVTLSLLDSSQCKSNFQDE